MVAPGDYDVSYHRVNAGGLSVGRCVHELTSVSFIVEYDSQITLMLPRRWSGELKINGSLARPRQMHLPDSEHSFYFAGQGRDMIGVKIDRDLFLKTVATLEGIPAGERVQRSGSVDLPPVLFERLQNVLMAFLYCDWRANSRTEDGCTDIVEAIFGLMCEAYLTNHAAQHSAAETRVFRNASHIVRAVEERFEEAGPAPLSLADLCQAAGVSKTSLYRAFQSHCNLSPLAYIKKRRYSRARSKLMAASPNSEMVKQIALSAGFTQLGRFSVEYRSLFGESPKATLGRLTPDRS